MKRPNKAGYYMGIATAVAARGTCERRKVGAVIVRDDRIISTGYNGSPRGMEHCLGENCEVEHGHCVRAVHAEQNAILQAAYHGSSTVGSTLFTTASCCRKCMQSCINAGIACIVYSDLYKDPTHGTDKSQWAFEAARQCGIDMVHVDQYGKPAEVEAEIFNIAGRGETICIEPPNLRTDQPANLLIVNGTLYEVRGTGLVNTRPVSNKIEVLLKKVNNEISRQDKEQVQEESGGN